MRLEGMDNATAVSGFSMNGRQLSLTLERSGEELGSLDLTLTVHGTALHTVRPAANLLLAAPADTTREAGGEALLTLTLTSGKNTVQGTAVVLLTSAESYKALQYREAFSETVFWVDNNNESGIRPSGSTFTTPQLSFRVTPEDGTYPSGFTVLEEKYLEQLGMKEIPKPEIRIPQTGGWTYTIPADKLPSEVEYTDIYGDKHTYTVEWNFTPQENDNYILRVVTENDVGPDGEIHSVDEPGWYYIQKRDLTFNISLLCGKYSSIDMEKLK